ncbi:VOC family protein [Sinorhizobium meliloti]|uniref:VOC family protein n=1 Tax=Rhizobium meliloti TaxID=382 RepID=UPI001F40BAF6|nr:VOC family protein [Sinorhizobium meliloti]
MSKSCRSPTGHIELPPEHRSRALSRSTQEPRSVAFFDLSNGVKLAIWDQDDLAHDSGLTKAPASSTSFSIGHNVSQRSEVDEVMEQAREAGAAIVKPAQETFYGGYAGYFTDPDGHLWEIVWNPGNLAERTDLSPLP